MAASLRHALALDVIGPKQLAPESNARLSQWISSHLRVVAFAYPDRDHLATVLSDLQPLIDERRGRRIMIAGDLNITTQWSVKHRASLHGMQEAYLARDHNVFERFTALGLHNIVERAAPAPLEGCECSAAPACCHVQTQRHCRFTFHWQNDCIFVRADLLARGPTVEVLDEEAA